LASRWIVCSAWPYINTVPHLGTLIGSALSADVFARYLRLRGYDVVFVSGSDEHGTPIEIEAVKRGVDCKSLTDKYHSLVKELFEKFELSFDNYTRTHNPIHIKFCQEFFMRLYTKGYIFEREVKQLYCPKCERFLPDRFVEGRCPYCGYERARGDQCDNCGRVLDPTDLMDPRCAICHSTPIIKTTKHWFFDLPRFSNRIREWIESNPRLPPNARRFSLRWLDEGLRPRAVTRDNRWGVPAPFPSAEGKTIYVWFEAVLGYVTATIEWARKVGNPDLWKAYWMSPDTKTIYFIGKDNIPFHVIILPALLMAYDERLALPWNVSSTEYLTFEGKKFSKSLGIGIWLDQAISWFPADYWRYYLIKIRPEKSDTNFSWSEFQQAVNNDLNDVLGNFIHRVLTFIYRNFEGAVPQPEEFDEEDQEMLKALNRAPLEIAAILENEVSLKKALERVMSLAAKGNAYLSSKEPWRMIKKDVGGAKTCLYVAAQVVASLSILLEPFIPNTATRLRDMINLRTSVSNIWDLAGSPLLKPGHKIGEPSPLFRKIPDAKIIELKKVTGAA